MDLHIDALALPLEFEVDLDLALDLVVEEAQERDKNDAADEA